ncbi:MAG: stage II sporulation protein M [Deltaproteobacteria bacterium]|nr:stage II sporulation protein M [Deltaproteobacteria bacterium]MCB9786216.1 stage II sporulation protein M [Deltaproteobacteria bacterium]
MSAFTLGSVAFRLEREEHWRELEALVVRVERGGVHTLSTSELARLPQLYRGAVSALSVARAISLDQGLVRYLDALCARAYLVVYAPRRPALQALGDFFSHRFPALVWNLRRPLLLAIALLFAGAVAGTVLTLDDPARFDTFVDAAYAQERGPDATRDELRAVLYDSEEATSLGSFASYLFTHNAKIGLTAFVVGLAACIPALLLMFINGLTLGAFLAIHLQRGLALDLLAWLSPHGVTELLAVCLCGAAGVQIGAAVLFPGRHRRLDGLARAGRDAATVAAGAMALFFIAALLEGFFRQLVQAMPVRFAVAALTAAGWSAYFLLLGRRAARTLPR